VNATHTLNSTMGKSKLSADERLVRRRTAARLRQQKCRLRKRLAQTYSTADKEKIETILKRKEFSPKRICSKAAFSPAPASMAMDEKHINVPMGSFVPYFMPPQQQQNRVMQHPHIMSSPIGNKHNPVSPNSTAQFGMVLQFHQQQAPHRMRHPNAYHPGLVIPRVVSDLSISQKEIHFSTSSAGPSPVGIGHLQDDSLALDSPGLVMEPLLCSTEQAAVDAMLSLQEHPSTTTLTPSPVVEGVQKRFRLPYRAHHPPHKQFAARFGREEQLHQGQVQPFM
jgi:hypothetical protein